ncbi:14960_t:CDS:2 [Cetraspora pellucida]|uniref:14960_t:CDS:1 n=1 Tax=Cetraspora pellucida TaxID=1433469 RepID=A0ACA9JY78_9GLOM|nr:14960_t:CDS:2 [Cetraspora pellucida]
MASNSSLVFPFLSPQTFQKIVDDYMSNRKNERHIMNRTKYHRCLVILQNPSRAMNTQVCKATKATPYQLVFGQEACSNLPIISMLHQQNIIHEENIPLENRPSNFNPNNIQLSDSSNFIYDDTQSSNSMHDNTQLSNSMHDDTQTTNSIQDYTQSSYSIHDDTQSFNSVYDDTPSSDSINSIIQLSDSTYGDIYEDAYLSDSNCENIQLSNFTHEDHNNNNEIVVISDSDSEENNSECKSNRQKKGKQVERDIVSDTNLNLSLSYYEVIDLDNEDSIKPSEENNRLIENSPTPSDLSSEMNANSSRASFSQHAQLREAANRHVTQNRQMIQNIMEKRYKTKKRTLNLKPGDLMKIRIPEIDRLKMDRRALPCKVIQKKPNCDSYQVGCKFGILDTWFSANELELLGTDKFPELDIIPMGKFISLRNAGAQQNLTRPLRPLQNITNEPSNEVTEQGSKKNDGCHCNKKNCESRSCSCRKNNALCTFRCGCVRRGTCKNH